MRERITTWIGGAGRVCSTPLWREPAGRAGIALLAVSPAIAVAIAFGGGRESQPHAPIPPHEIAASASADRLRWTFDVYRAGVASVPETPLNERPMPLARVAPVASPPLATSASTPPVVGAAAAIVVDADSGVVLYDKNAHQSLLPASLTKIATAIIALEQGDLDEWVEVDIDSRRMPNSSLMGLLPGDRFTLRDLLYGLMLPSGNDAALAIGRHLAGSDEAFVEQMNELVARAGLTETHFADAHGLGKRDLSLPEGRRRDNYTSAHDLAMLSRYAMTFPEFREIVKSSNWTAVGSRTLGLWNTNSFLGMYQGADGLKTGFTYHAGRTLSVTATRDGHRLFVVVLNAPEREVDAAKLFDWAFANHCWSTGDDTCAGEAIVAPAQPSAVRSTSGN